LISEANREVDGREWPALCFRACHQRVYKRFLLLTGSPCPAQGNPRYSNAGFTLIEMLVAFALLAVILGAIYSTFFLSHKAMAGMDDWLIRLQECRMAIDMMGREADSILYGSDIQNPVFKIEDREAKGKKASRFTFQTFSPLMPGLCLISYSAEERDGKLIIFKEMQSAFRPGTQGQKVEVMEDVEAFSVEAGDKDQWIKTWDASGRKAIPSQLRFTITISIKDRRLSLTETAQMKIGRSILMQ
jgi:general secretion pathway protein J